MDAERAAYNIESEVQFHAFGDFYRKTYQPLHPICVRICIEFINDSIACRPCPLLLC